MKPYINALLTRLGTVSALKTIDTNWGQLAYEQPPVQFPCALVDIQSTSVGYAKHNLTNVKATVSVTIANTRLTAVGRSVNGGLSFFDTLESVVNALDQWTDGRFDRLQLTGMTPTNTAPGFDAYILSFSTAFSLDTLPFEPLQPTTGDIEDPNLPPRWFREACFAWYSPRRQGITNEQLSDEYPEWTGGLQDLSGNGNHITLYDMDGEEGGGCVDDNGDLVFDGVDDFGECVKQITSADLLNGAFATVVDTSYHDGYRHVYFFAYKSSNNQPGSNNQILTFTKDGSGNGRYYLGYNNSSNKYYWLKDSTVEEIMKSLIANFLIGCEPNAGFNSTIVTFPAISSSSNSIIATPSENTAKLCIGKAHNGIYPHVLRELLLFKRNLTHEEAEWVKENILEGWTPPTPPNP